MTAFDLDVAAVIAQRGISIQEQDMPQDFALELASPSTGRKRAGYRPTQSGNTGPLTAPAGSTTGKASPATVAQTGPISQLILWKPSRSTVGAAVPCWA